MQLLTFVLIGFAGLATVMADTSLERKLENLARELFEREGGDDKIEFNPPDQRGNKSCASTITPAKLRKCPDGHRDDGLSCWKDTYARGVGRIPDKTPCAKGQRDDGVSCWIDAYGRGAGRLPDLRPCPEGLRDDGVSCWRDAHIYGKGCCCTWWGCCGNCPSGYNDDGCTCRKTGTIGIVVTLFERQNCREHEEMSGGRCYPRCKAGYHASGCCICTPNGGARIDKTLSQRQRCKSDEEMSGALCYPKCKQDYRAVGCCLCEPNEGPGIKITQPERQYCDEPYSLINGVCVDVTKCSAEEVKDMEKEKP